MHLSGNRWVFCPDSNPTEILRFFTLAFCEILVEKLRRKYAKKYPARAPAAKLARLAIKKNLQRKGLGTQMMVNAIERILRVSENLEIIGFLWMLRTSRQEHFMSSLVLSPFLTTHWSFSFH